MISNSHRYTHLTMRSMDSLYSAMSASTLEKKRCNEGKNLGGEGDSVGIDDVNEKWHIFIKKMLSNSKEGLVKGSVSLPFDISCQMGRDTITQRAKPSTTKSIPPQRQRALKLVGKLLDEVDVFHTDAEMNDDLFLDAAVKVAQLPEVGEQKESKVQTLMEQMLKKLKTEPSVAQEVVDEVDMLAEDRGEQDDQELERAEGALDVVEDGSVEKEVRLAKLKERLQAMKRYGLHKYAKLDWFEHAKATMLPNAIQKYKTKKERRLFTTAVFKNAQEKAVQKRNQAEKMIEDMLETIGEEGEELLPEWKKKYHAFMAND